jgi:hypothetical protein
LIAVGALVACLLAGAWALAVASGAGANAANRHLRAIPAPAPLVSAPRPESIPQRAVLASTGSATVRALVPERIAVNRPTLIVVDLWDGSGYPSGTEVRCRLEGELKAALDIRPTEMPGQYRLEHTFTVAGPVDLVVEAPAYGLEISIPLLVIDDGARS